MRIRGRFTATALHKSNVCAMPNQTEMENAVFCIMVTDFMYTPATPGSLYWEIKAALYSERSCGNLTV